MGSKREPGKFDCYSNALPDEPMFILLARDPNAPALVEAWASRREQEIGAGNRPDTDRPMVTEARQCAANMRAWRTANDGKWRAASPATAALGSQEGEWFITEFIGGGTSNIIANAPDPMKRRCLACAIDENAAALIVAAHNAALASHARTIEALRAALDRLVNAKALEGVRAIVAGWNGEGKPDGPYERHPNKLGATLPKTNCGAVYELDEALTDAARALKENPNG